MRCSSCKPLLERYVAGRLTPRGMARISAHVRECAECSALLDEIKVVEGLLFTAPAPDLPQNFTFAVMAEVQTLPAPRARQHPLWSFLVLYPAAAWAAIVVAMALTRTSPNAVAGMLAGSLSRAGAASGAFAANISHGLSTTMPSLAAFGAGVLLIDAVVACAFALLYVVVRPRLAAHLAPSREAVQ